MKRYEIYMIRVVEKQKRGLKEICGDSLHEREMKRYEGHF